MPIEPTEAIETLQRSLALMPPAILAIIFLAGPTAAWLLYRFVVQPRTRRYAAGGSDLLWICDQCRSANEVRSSRCYRCAMDREAITGALQIVDGDEMVSLGPDDEDLAPYPLGQPVMAASTAHPPVAVGPGRTRPEPTSTQKVGPVAEPGRPSVAVGPGKEASAVPAQPRKVVAAGRAEPAQPAQKGTRKRD